MNMISAVGLGVLALMAATVATGRAQNAPSGRTKTSKVPAISQEKKVQSIPTITERSVPEATPLFMIGGVPVYLWAPVEPPYNAHANLDPAADPLWLAGMSTPQSGF